MAIVWATTSGNASDGSIWNTGVVPDINYDVYADGNNIIIDIANWSVLSLRTTNRGGGTAGGTFTIATSSYVATMSGFYSGTPSSKYGAFKML